MRTDGGNGRTDRTDVQKAATLFGIIFLIVGVAGFIPGITTDYDRLTTFDDQGAKLLGVFGVNIIENIAHLLFGIAGLALARSYDGARTYLIGGGAIYAVLWIYGLLVGQDSAANFVPVNRADNWLHLVLAIAMIAGGVLLTRGERDRAARTA